MNPMLKFRQTTLTYLFYFHCLVISSESIVSFTHVTTKILIHIHLHIRYVLRSCDFLYFLISISFVPGECWCRNTIWHTLQRHCLTNPWLGSWCGGFLYCRRVWKINMSNKTSQYQQEWMAMFGTARTFISCMLRTVSHIHLPTLAILLVTLQHCYWFLLTHEFLSCENISLPYEAIGFKYHNKHNRQKRVMRITTKSPWN